MTKMPRSFSNVAKSYLSFEGKQLFDNGLSTQGQYQFQSSSSSSGTPSLSGMPSSSFLPSIFRNSYASNDTNIASKADANKESRSRNVKREKATSQKKKKSKDSIASKNSRRRKVRRRKNNLKQQQLCKTSVSLYANQHREWIANQVNIRNVANKHHTNKLPPKKKLHRRISSMSAPDKSSAAGLSLFLLQDATLQAKKSYDAVVDQVSQLTSVSGVFQRYDPAQQPWNVHILMSTQFAMFVYNFCCVKIDGNSRFAQIFLQMFEF